MTALLILLALMAVLFMGVPVAFALGGLGMVLLWSADLSLLMVPQGLYSVMDSFILLAVPLFLLMSNVLLKGGVGRDLFNAVQSWVGHWPGGLGVATIVSCAIFAAISGSSVATAATIGTVAIREMTERGYQRPFVLGLVAAGGTLGILIPPSIPMIVYGVITEESIVDLFLAGVGPGLMLAGLFILFCFGYARFSASYRPMPRASAAERRRASIRALPTLLLSLVVIGGIYLGVFTPTESAAIGFAVSLIIVFALRTMTWARLKQAVIESMQTTVTIFLILAGAKIFGKAITLYRIPQDISLLISSNISEPALFILVVCMVLLLMGLFLESLSMLLIMVPVLYPSLVGMGIDPIWFGVLFVVMIECALITPPVGMNLFVIQAVGEARLQEVVKGVWPFTLMMLASVLLLYLWPDIALYIPFKL
ncbi:MAG TPA: TRAP transporter large permease subunit [Sedimenticola thiotaurini]|uniref:TRAP transporter large permease protein n=1 Tax=Sedimenticola thiotaurini TaxID=1543721 RepID=A0A831RKU5_9GAMM|nr:TRAP transporter large permease subunit [Sedimenticola thiotaurini]